MNTVTTNEVLSALTDKTKLEKSQEQIHTICEIAGSAVALQNLAKYRLLFSSFIALFRDGAVKAKLLQASNSNESHSLL